MRKTSLPLLFTIVALVGLLTGCSKEKTPPITERIAKIWTARIVEENSVVVYSRGVTNPAPVRPTYSNFRLDLVNAPTARYTEFDGNTFVGQYTVTDSKLTLTSLNPQPTGTTGTIEFTINSISDNELVLTRSSQSQKTGNSTNKYTLSNP
ncbi:hypothetical protein DYU11_05075 [Fibrisoma montanum]|uniref:Lipocalin-like domain-containing protein n=1 Tax=Fibrisoma montanum TaxID=2305895 RepID=A0A418MJL9_9BACT|nr:hypothetical protein [Fibrisoma montanum]RIV27678.1 hypothetical protein DYU11_05075 [Fibrisoma montanum]